MGCTVIEEKEAAIFPDLVQLGLKMKASALLALARKPPSDPHKV
jgi:hypothetical protein